MKKRRVVKIFTWILVLSLMTGTMAPISASAAKKPKLNKKKVTLTVGSSTKLKLKNAKKKIKWSSSNKKVVTVNKKGKVKAINTGNAKITAKCAGKKYTCKVVVKAKGSNGNGSDVATKAPERTGVTTSPSGTGKTEGTVKPGATAGSSVGSMTDGPSGTPGRTKKPLASVTISPATQQPSETETPIATVVPGVSPNPTATAGITKEPSATDSPTATVKTTFAPTATTKTTSAPTSTVKASSTPSAKPSATANVTNTPTSKPETTSTTKAYTVTIDVLKDGTSWSNHGKTFQLTKDSGSTFVTDLTKVENGEYDVYLGSVDTKANVTVKNGSATATVKYFTVTFMDGSSKLASPAQQVVLIGTKATEPNITPTKSGYQFVNWVTTQNGSTVFNFATKSIYGATSVYAKWKEVSGSVTTSPNTTSTVSPTKEASATPTVTSKVTSTPIATATSKVTSTPIATATTTPSYEVSITVKKDGSVWEEHGRQFQLSSDGGETFITNLSQVPNGDYDVYEDGVDTKANVSVKNKAATATVNYYTVTFMDGAAQMASPAQQIVLSGTKVTEPDITPGKNGYSFAGWVTTQNGSTAFNFATKSIYSATKVYASWEKDSSKAVYTAKYYFQNITDDGYPSEPGLSEQLEGIVESTTPNYGRAFEGFTALSSDTVTISGSGTTVVEYYYTRNTYSIIWNTAGGTIHDTEYTQGFVKYGSTIQAPTNLTKSGYLFAGWNTDILATMPAKGIAYTAQWELAPTVAPTITPTPVPTETPTYTVTIGVNKDGVSWNNHGKQFQLTSDGGTTFITDLSKVVNGTYEVYEGAVTTKAKVTVENGNASATVNYYTVTFMDGSIPLAAPEQQVVLIGNKAVEPDVIPGKTGYRFAGWLKKENSETAFNFSTTSIYSATKVYASWVADSSKAAYTAEYYFQNVENDNYAAEPALTEQLEGIVESATPVYGRDFEGFTAQASETVTISGSGTTVAKYYYQRNYYNLTWNVNGGTIHDTNHTSGSLKYETVIQAPTNLTRSGYLFEGWNTTIAVTMPAQDVTYTAQWSKVSTPTPTVAPTATVTVAPTATVVPTAIVTAAPTATAAPSAPATVVPTATTKVTVAPTVAPTKTPSYAVTIEVYKDWQSWTGHEKQFALSSDNGISFITDLSAVKNGTYDIYENGTDTNVDVVVNGNAVTATVYYFTVKFMDGNILLASPEEQIVVRGGVAVEPANTPGKTGYSFVDWVTYEGSDSVFDFENTTITNTTSIYASWKADPTTAAYTAEYYLQNIEDDDYPSEPAQTEQLEGLIGSTVPTYGKEITGFTALAADTTTISGSGNTVVKYYYKRNTYELTWDTVGGTINDNSYTNGDVKYGTAIQSPNNITKSGYLFTGWDMQVEATMPAKSLVYTAQWTSVPTVAPTATVTVAPTIVPTVAPTATVTVAPTIVPTVAPTATVTVAPTKAPTVAPTATVTVAPTATPIMSPTATPAIVAKYKVNHFRQNIEDDDYSEDLCITENFTATAGDRVTPKVKSFTGFIAPSTQTVTVEPDGSTIVNYYYDRKTYTVTWVYQGGSWVEDDYDHVVGTDSEYDDDYFKLYGVKYGTYIIAPKVERSRYNLVGWHKNPEPEDPNDEEAFKPGEMPDDEDFVYYALWERAEEDEPIVDGSGEIWNVELGMTETQLVNLLGTPLRKDSTPQGYEGYVYNKDGNYENYIMVYVDNGIVVGMATMSPNFGYGDHNIGDNPKEKPLTGFVGMSNSYDYTSACYKTTETEHIVAFIDRNGSQCVYAMLIFSTTDGNGNTVELEDLLLAENLTYTEDVIADSAVQLADWVNAYRYYMGLELAEFIANGSKPGADAAQNHSEDMAANNNIDSASSDGTSYKTRFDANYKSIVGLGDEDTLGKGENNGGRSPDAFGFVTWWIDNSTDTFENIARDVSEDGYTYYLCTGFAYNGSASNKTFATLDFFY